MMLTGARPSIALSRLRIGPEIGLVLRRVAHVVDGQHDDRLDARLADPLRRGQLGEVAMRGNRGRTSSRYDQAVAVGRSRRAIEREPGRAGRQPARNARRASHGADSSGVRADDGPGPEFRGCARFPACWQGASRDTIRLRRSTIHGGGRRPIENRTRLKPRLILASASPRRRQLLDEAGYTFEVDPSDVEEPAAGPGDVARGLRRAPRLAEGDGRRPAAASGLILAADTVCAVAGADPQQAARTAPTPSG